MEAPLDIPIDSLDTFDARYNMEDRVVEWDALYDGRAVLRLPTGKRYWMPVHAGSFRVNLPGPAGEALLNAVLDHNAIAKHAPREMFFDWETNTLTSVFCTVCGTFVDLAEDVRKMDELGIRDE